MKKVKNNLQRVCCLVLTLLLLLPVGMPYMESVAAEAGLPSDTVECSAAVYCGTTGESPATGEQPVPGPHTRLPARPPHRGNHPVLLGAESSQKNETLMLVPGGMPFGVRMQSKGLMIVGLSEVKTGGVATRPAYDGGIRVKDILLEIDGKAVTTAEEATAAIAAGEGRSLTMTVLRGDARMNFTVTPKKCDESGTYRCGLYLRDTTSGIGTLTFFDPSSGLFGGLGHGVCDADTGTLVPLSYGTVLPVRITGVVRGEAGKPGELRGALGGKRLGSLVTNSECGVFGLLTEKPTTAQKALPVADASEVQEGEATLLCTLGEDGVCSYTVEISNIDHGGRPTKSFTVHVTDEKLLSRTGGIVQGMSGSPLIQNGKIIGAVTHVLIDDPTSGYGIFIGNMLSAMKMRAVA